MKKQILSIIMAGCLLLSMTACSSDKKNTKSASEQTTADTSTSTNSPQEYSKTDFVMSTVLSEKIYGTKDVTQDIKEELDKLEKEQLSWREDSSIVSKINADAQKGTKTKLDSDMTSWVEDSLELAKRSNGAFDPTIGRLTRLWNIEGDNPKVPSKQEIKNTLKDTGYTKIHLEKVETQNTDTTKKNVDKDIKDNTDKNGDAAKDTDNNTINSIAQNTGDNMVNNEANNTPDNTALNEERLEPTDKKTNTDESISSIYIEDQCTLDLGAVGKGIACDVAQNYLKQQKEVSGAVIAVGGRHPLIWKQGRRNQLECRCTKSKRQGWRSNGSPVPLWHNQRFHIRRLRKVLHAKRKKIPPHPRSFNRLSSRKQSDFCNSSKRQRLTLRRSFHRLFCPRQRKRPKTFRNLRSRRHFHRPE